MKRGKRFLAVLLAALLSAGSLQLPAVSMMTTMPVFAADTAEAQAMETATVKESEENSSMEEGENPNADAVGDTSADDEADQTAENDADANEETSGISGQEPAEEDWQEEPAEVDSAAGDRQDGGFEIETDEEQEAESAFSDEDRNGGATQSTETAETAVNETEDLPASDDLSAVQEAASETGTELTTEQIRAFQEKVRIWKDGNQISMVYASAEDIRLAYSIYPGVADPAETSDDPLYSGVLGWDDESGLYYEAVDFDAVNEADAGRNLSQIDIRDIPVYVVIEDGRNRYLESVGSAPGVVEIESAELNNGNIDIAWDGIGGADGYAVIVKGSGLDIYDSTSTETSVSASESEEYVIEVSAYAYDENAGIMQFGEAGSRDIALSEDSQNKTKDEMSEEAQAIPAGEFENTDETTAKGAEEQEKVLTEPGNLEIVSSDAMMDAVESGTCGENLTWTLDDVGTLIVSGTGEMTSAPWRSDYNVYRTIKNVIINNGVTNIEDLAFYGCDNLVNIIIPSSVTKVGNSAFEGCTHLQNINIPQSVTSIGEAAFQYCGLTDITIPHGVTNIGYAMFWGCSHLTSITIPSSLESIGTSAFRDCINLKNITIPDGANIEGYAFHGCRSLESITLPSDLKKIWSSTFDYCSSLKSITIPASVIDIDGNISQFVGCSSLMNIIVESGNTVYSSQEGVLFNKEQTELICCPGGKEGVYTVPVGTTCIKPWSFSGCANLTRVSIPTTVTSIGAGTFENCRKLRNITIPEGVINIGNETFENCSSLRSIIIPDSVTCIGRDAFFCCSSLSNVTIPSSVLSIGSSAFWGCSSLSSIVIPEGVTSIEHNTFKNCSSLCSITFSSRVTNIGREAFSGCNNLNGVTIPEGVKSIDTETFYHCENIRNVVIPSSVTSIGRAAFWGCSSLRNVTILSSIMSIADYAFDSSTESIYFHGSAPLFDTYAFEGLSATVYYPVNDETWSDEKMKDYGGDITWISWFPNASLSFDNNYQGFSGNGVAISATFTSSVSPNNIIWGSNNDGITFSETSTLGPFEGNQGTEYYISTMATAQKSGYYDITLEVDGKKAHTTLYVSDQSEDKGRLTITPGPITLETGKKYVIKASYYDEEGNLAEPAGGINWSSTSIYNNGGAVNVKAISDYYEYCLCEVTGVKAGTCGVFASTESGLSVPVTFYVVDSASTQKDTVGSAQPTGHLSGSKDYELVQTEEGEIDLSAPITSKVTINSQSYFNSVKIIEIKNNGELIIKGRLNAEKIIIKAGGKLTVSYTGHLSVNNLIAEGGGWFSQKSGGIIDIYDGGVLNAWNVTVKDKGRLSMSGSAQLMAFQSFTYNGQEPSPLEGMLFIGGSLDVGKYFKAPDSGFETVFYNDTTSSEFSFHDSCKLGTVYAENAERYNAIGLSPNNIAVGMQYLKLEKKDDSAWELTRSNKRFETNWEAEVGAWYQNLAEARTSVFVLDSYQDGGYEFTKAECKFVSKLADTWVTTISGQLVNEGFSQYTSGTYDLIIKLHNKKYKIRYNASGMGAYANTGSVLFGSENAEDDEMKVMGLTAAASTDNFWSQATAYLAENCVKQYYEFVKGSIPKGKSEEDLKGILKKKGKDFAKKYFEKVVNRYLFSTLNETENSAEVNQIINTFKVSEMALNGDIKGLWKFAIKESKSGLKSSRVISSQPVQKNMDVTLSGSEKVSSEAEAGNLSGVVTESVLEEASAEGTGVIKGTDTAEVTDEFLKNALIEVLGKDAEGNPDFSKEESITFLDLSGRYIQSLQGIQQLTGLKTLILENNEIEDLEPLRDMTGLQYLDVSGQNIKDISVLSGLVDLLYLDVSDNDIESISSVGNMTKLRELDVSDTQVSSLVPLETVGSLQALSASSIPLEQENLQSLTNMKKLKELHIEGCGLQSLEGLNILSLEELYASENYIQSIAVICTAEKLKKAVLSDNLIKTIPSLLDCSSLTFLDLSGNLLMDIDGLAEGKTVKELDVSGCWLVDSELTDISGMSALESIDLSFNAIEDISPLLEVGTLKSVILTGTDTDLGDYADIPRSIEFTDASVVASGACGEDARWIVTDKGRLIIYGKGDMEDYNSDAAPWADYLVSDIRIGNGITNIGNKAFSGMAGLQTMYIPENVVKIGDLSFSNCGNLRVCIVLDTIREIGKNAFLNCADELVIYCLPDSGAEAYARESDISFKYIGVDSKEITEAIISVTPQTYTGKPLTPEPEVVIEDVTLKKDIDYTVSYEKNTDAGTATLTVMGKDNYTGTKTATFEIAKASQSITASNLSLTYPNSGKITASGNEGTLSFTSSSAAIATVDSTGKVTAKGVGSAKITITAAETANYNRATKTVTITVNKASQSIAAKSSASSIAVGQTATVSITGAVGAKSYKSSLATVASVNAAGTITAKKVGSTTITATAAATANYNAASKTVSIKVVPAATSSLTAANQATGIKLTWKSVAGATGYKVYRGSTLVKTIKCGSTITCTDAKANTNGAKYTFKVVPTAPTGDGLAKTLTTYRVARPAVSSAKNTAARKMTVRWKKNARATGYQIQYSTNKKFASGNKTVNITKAATVSKVIAGLAKGKTYYVRIRTYKKVGKAKYWSIWSPVKSVKIAK